MTDSPARSLIERAAEAFDFAAPRAPEPPPARPPLSLVPRAGVVDRARLREAGFALPDAGASALGEELRILKRQLLHGAGSSARDRMVLVASAQSGEGKTFCAVALALSLAQERDWEVLLVDADVAKPSVLSTLGLDAGPGLLDALADERVDPEALVIRTDLGGLSVLPAGRASNDAAELLASDRTRAVLDRLTAPARRVVLFDSPPALAAAPASELAHHAGQVMLVVRADVTGEAELREAVALLGGGGALRLLLNGVGFRPGGARFGSYYGYGS